MKTALKTCNKENKEKNKKIPKQNKTKQTVTKSDKVKTTLANTWLLLDYHRISPIRSKPSNVNEIKNKKNTDKQEM